MRGTIPGIIVFSLHCVGLLFAQIIPDDEYFSRQWGLLNAGQPVDDQPGVNGADIDILGAWKIYSGASQVIVAILSAGVDEHPEYSERLLEGFATQGDLYDSRDTGGRGTLLAGTIGASANNANGIAGIYPEVWILPVRIQQGSSANVDHAAEGIVRAVDFGVDVILVAAAFSSYSQTLEDAVDYANLHDVVVIAPAGDNATSDPVYPGALSGCVAVNATTNMDTIASFSNFGDYINISAPGVFIWSTQRSQSFAYDSSSFTASAFVAGVASLIRAYAPQINAEEVKQILIESADDLGDVGWDPSFGAGRINAQQALMMTSAPALRIEHPESLPLFIAPDQTTSFVIQITDAAEFIIPDSALIFYRTQQAKFNDSKLESLSNNQYRVELPGGHCGDILEYYFVAVGDGGTVVTDPVGAPQSIYQTHLMIETDVFYDDFETDRGWEVISPDEENTRGLWIRVDPVGTIAQPEYDFSFDEKSYCFVTGQHFGGVPELTDVDNGPVQLISPVIELSEPDARIQFAYQFYWSGQGNEDFLTVDFSRDGGETWTDVENFSTGVGWMTHQFQLSDFPDAKGHQLRVRFTASDLPNDSLTEAAIDEFRVTGIRCHSRQGDANGDGLINLDDFDSMLTCWSGPAGLEIGEECVIFDMDGSTRVDLKDFFIFQNLFDLP